MSLPFDGSNWFLIGVDGGASKVCAQRVLADERSDDLPLLRPAGVCARRSHPLSSGFRSVPIERQLFEHDAGEYCLTGEERSLGSEWIRDFAECIHEASGAESGHAALIGVAAPGWKTREGRGIAVCRNGPRIPDFSDRLEAELSERGIELLRPLPPLASDGACSGMGEEFGPCGSFRGATSAYYVGGGTGVAESLKLAGRLLGFEEVEEWLLRAWQLRAANGREMEDVISAAGLNDEYARRSGADRAGAPAERPEVAALRGDEIACAVIAEAARALADLVFQRIVVVRGGKRTRLGFGETHRDLRANHPYVGTLLERVVLGGRLARFHAEASLDRWFREPFEEHLVECLHAQPDEELRDHFLEDGRLRAERVRASAQARAPVIGAACVAWREAGGNGSRADRENFGRGSL